MRAPGGGAECACSANLLDTAPPRVLAFPAGAPDLEAVRGSVLALDPGLYELAFAFHYSVGGEDRARRSRPFVIYMDE